MKQSDTVKKLAMAGVLTAVAVIGSLLSFPIFGSKMCTGAAYGKYSGGGCTWTGMGGRHCILRKPAP